MQKINKIDSSDIMLSQKWPLWAASSILVLAAFVVYLPAINGAFIWDDSFNILDNPLLKTPEGLTQIWTRRISSSATGGQLYPLTTTMFWIEWHLWGSNTTGYHMVNVILHTINSILVWRLLNHLKVRGAWFAGAIFLLHPVCVESVAWITERKNVLSGLFFLLSVGSYLLFENNRRWRWYISTLGLFAMALLSKPSSVMLPVTLLLLRWWLKKPWSWKEVCLLIPFFVMSVLVAGGTIWFEQHVVGAIHSTWDASLLEKIAISGKIVWFYMGKILIPYNLTFIYPRWTIDVWKISSYASTISLVFLGVVLWRQRNGWGRPLLMGLGYFVVNLFPVLGFFNIYFMRYSFVADHFQYLASIGLIALFVSCIVWGLEQCVAISVRSMPGIIIGTSIGLVVLVIFGMLSWQQTHIFQDEEMLWRDTIDKNPQAWMAYNNLGLVLSEEGQQGEAILLYKKVLEVDPTDTDVHYNLAQAYRRKGLREKAIFEYTEVLRLYGDHFGSYNNLGILYGMDGRYDEAVEKFRRAIEMHPDDKKTRNNLGFLYVKMGNCDAARVEFEYLLGTDSENIEVSKLLDECAENRKDLQ